MYKTLTVAIREYNAAVRTKAFIISIVLMPIMMGGMFVAMKVLEGRVDTKDKRVALVDRSGILAPVLVKAAELRNKQDIFDEETGKQIKPEFKFTVIPPSDGDPQAQRFDLSNKIRSKEFYAFVEIASDVVHPNAEGTPTIRYYSENLLYGDIRNFMRAPINNHVRALRLSEAGLDSATVDKLTQWVATANLGLLTLDKETGGIKEAQKRGEEAAALIPFFLMIFMFMMIMMGSIPLINSVLEEKMLRIAEVLLGSVTPFQMMMGKLVGTVGASLTVFAVYVIGAIVAAQQTGKIDYVPFDILPWFFVYQVAAIFMFGAVFIAIGSACNDLKEAQSMIMPVWMILYVPMFVGINVVKEPTGSLATSLSLVPPFTPMLMLLRQCTQVGIPAWQPWVGLLGVVLTTVLCVWTAGRIFRVGILMQGKPPKLGAILKWAVRG